GPPSARPWRFRPAGWALHDRAARAGRRLGNESAQPRPHHRRRALVRRVRGSRAGRNRAGARKRARARRRRLSPAALGRKRRRVRGDGDAPISRARAAAPCDCGRSSRIMAGDAGARGRPARVDRALRFSRRRRRAAITAQQGGRADGTRRLPRHGRHQRHRTTTRARDGADDDRSRAAWSSPKPSSDRPRRGRDRRPSAGPPSRRRDRRRHSLHDPARREGSPRRRWRARGGVAMKLAAIVLATLAAGCGDRDMGSDAGSDSGGDAASGLGSVDLAGMGDADGGATAGQWITGTFSNDQGQRDYRLYVPSGYRPGTPLPLVVMLHGCTVTAEQMDATTQYAALAEARTFLVVYPVQSSAANPALCWNWFETADLARGAGEPSLIAGITQTVMDGWSVDSRRVYVIGASAGGAMSVIMGATYPDRYAAIGVVAGCEYA